MTNEKEEGIEAIIFLQKMNGITETKEQAERGWSRMSQLDKDFTLKLYRGLKKRAMEMK